MVTNLCESIEHSENYRSKPLDDLRYIPFKKDWHFQFEFRTSIMGLNVKLYCFNPIVEVPKKCYH